MTSIVSGFIVNGSLTNNDRDQIATFGEISNYCRTFSKDIQIYGNETWPGISALIFKAHNAAGDFNLQNDQFDRIVEIGGWIYATALAFEPNSTQNDFVVRLQNMFNDFITEISVSKLQSDGERRMPARVTFTLKITGRDDARVTLWFSNSAFEAEYDNYTIDVYSPVDNVDDLFKPYGTVQQLAIKRTTPEVMRGIETLKNKRPCTITEAVAISWVDPADSNNRVSFTWYVNIYGPSGNTTDNINNALIEHILSHSTSPIEDWKLVLPDLFRTTNFVVLPRWDRIAIPFRTGTVGMYSPVLSLREAKAFAVSKLPDYSAPEIENLSSITSHPFRSLSLVIIAGKDNRLGAQVFEEHIPDYIGQEAIGEDFHRQSLNTQAWVTMMGKLLRAAETQSISAPPPIGVRKFTRDGVVYLSQKIDNVEYMVAVKASYGDGV